ncbi:hypothetical protein Tco_1431619, partial [Tanacetum coccineum]
SFRIPIASGKLHDRNAEESWALLEDLTLYENESWNDPRDFAKPAKAISLMSIWKAFGGNTRDLGLFREEMDKTTNLHQHLSRISTQKLETASQITRDAVTTHLKTASQDFQTASDCTTQPIIYNILLIPL